MHIKIGDYNQNEETRQGNIGFTSSPNAISLIFQ